MSVILYVHFIFRRSCSNTTTNLFIQDFELNMTTTRKTVTRNSSSSTDVRTTQNICSTEENPANILYITLVR